MCNILKEGGNLVPFDKEPYANNFKIINNSTTKWQDTTDIGKKKIEELNVDNLPVIVMGDFNLRPETVPIQLLAKYLNDTKKISVSKPFGPTGTFNGFNFSKPVLDRIDYIFTSKEQIQVLKYAVLSDSKDCSFPSDHLPVLVELKFINQ